MKRFFCLILILLFAVCVAVCAQAAEITPADSGLLEIDLNNGSFCMAVKDLQKISDGGWFTAVLYTVDRYDANRIEAMAPGDTVLVNGQAWTVQEVIPHEADEAGLSSSYEIYTEEENDGYIVFVYDEDSGCYICAINDWSPVTFVADVRIMLPLPDAFEYWRETENEPGNMDTLLNDLEEYGTTFVPYNTFCTFKDGLLVGITHSSYPIGPEIAAEEVVDAAEPEESDDTEAVPVWKFCHGLRNGLESAVIKGYFHEDEEGSRECEMTPEEIEDVRSIAIDGVITEKASDLSVTGGTWFYTFETPEGDHLLTVEMYKGWIVSVDGMYKYRK